MLVKAAHGVLRGWPIPFNTRQVARIRPANIAFTKVLAILEARDDDTLRLYCKKLILVGVQVVALTN